MADDSGPCGQGDLGAVLEIARRRIRRGDAWEPENYDRLRRDCEKIGIRGEPAITVSLRKCLAEIRVEDLRARDDPATAACVQATICTRPCGFPSTSGAAGCT